MSAFKGIVKLSQEQYESLKTNGTITVGEQTITYDPKTTVYVTPTILTERVEIIENQLGDINTALESILGV